MSWLKNQICNLFYRIQAMDFQNPDGRFPGLYHHHARMCYLLMRLGLQGNRLLDRAFHWIVERQREDGGWLHRSMIQKGKSIKSQKSCIWTSSEILLVQCHVNKEKI